MTTAPADTTADTTAENVYIDVREAADILSFHPKTVQRMCRAEVLVASRIGGGRGHFRILRSSVDDYLARTRVQGDAGPGADGT